MKYKYITFVTTETISMRINIPNRTARGANKTHLSENNVRSLHSSLVSIIKTNDKPRVGSIRGVSQRLNMAKRVGLKFELLV